MMTRAAQYRDLSDGDSPQFLANTMTADADFSRVDAKFDSRGVKCGRCDVAAGAVGLCVRTVRHLAPSG